MSDLMLDVGQANELKLAFRRADWSNDDIKRLCEGSILADVRSVLRGHAAINVVEHVIDCDADPFVPDGHSVEEHQKGGSFRWNKDAQKDALYPSKSQAGSEYIEGQQAPRGAGETAYAERQRPRLSAREPVPHSRGMEGQGRVLLGHHLPRL